MLFASLSSKISLKLNVYVSLYFHTMISMIPSLYFSRIQLKFPLRYFLSFSHHHTITKSLFSWEMLSSEIPKMTGIKSETIIIYIPIGLIDRVAIINVERAMSKWAREMRNFFNWEEDDDFQQMRKEEGKWKI